MATRSRLLSGTFMVQTTLLDKLIPFRSMYRSHHLPILPKLTYSSLSLLNTWGSIIDNSVRVSKLYAHRIHYRIATHIKNASFFIFVHRDSSRFDAALSQLEPSRCCRYAPVTSARQRRRNRIPSSNPCLSTRCVVSVCK